MNISLFLIFAHVQGRQFTYYFLILKKMFDVAIYSYSIKVRTFKFCMVITLFRIYVFILCQGHSEDLYDKNMTISTLPSKLLLRLQLNLV